MTKPTHTRADIWRIRLYAAARTLGLAGQHITFEDVLTLADAMWNGPKPRPALEDSDWGTFSAEWRYGASLKDKNGGLVEMPS